MNDGGTPAPLGAAADGAHTLIIMRHGRLTMDTFYTYQAALEAMRVWYADLIDDHSPPERVELRAEFGAPATATVTQMNAFFGCWGDRADYWCDVVPVEAVLNRIAPTMIRHAAQAHAALVLADGLVNAQACASYDAALAVLQVQASAWGHDDLPLDPATATIEDLAQAYSDGSAGQWLGIMPILATDDGPAVLVPIDRLPAQI